MSQNIIQRFTLRGLYVLESQRHKMSQKVTLVRTRAPVQYYSPETMKHKKERKKERKKEN